MSTLSQLRIYSLYLVVLCVGLSSCAHKEDAASPEAISGRLIENLLSRPEYMRYGDDGLHYAEACAVMGALRLADQNDSRSAIDRIEDRYRPLLEPGADLISSKAHVDFSVIGIVPLQLYLANGDTTQLEFGLGFADRQWEQPLGNGLTPETRWWIDDMYMVGTLQTQAFRATGDPVYIDRAARFLYAYLDSLQQENGLFFHGPEARFHWGRGNGWVASALVETLSSLPETHPLRNDILRRYLRMMEALAPLQSEAGMWRQLVDHPEALEESSSTAMFAFALQAGINHGWLARNRYQPIVDRAWSALLERLDADGNLSDICVGTGQSDDVQYYLDRPRHNGDFHGQAPLLWLATELWKAGQRGTP